MKTLVSVLTAVALTASLTLSAFAINPYGEAKAVHNLTNAQRRAHGLGTLKWDETLVKAAQLRAEESAEYYTSDHTRPDGSKYYTTNALVWGENTAYGQVDAERVMNAWMNSESHKKNILDERFTIMGAACVVTDESIYWVQAFGTGESNYIWTNVENYSFGGKEVAEVAEEAGEDIEESIITAGAQSSAAAEKAASTGMAVDSNGEIVSNALSAELVKATVQERTNTVAIRVKDAEFITPGTLKTMTRLANEGEKIALINADTMTASGKSVQGRMVVEPARLLGRSSDLKLGVYVDSDSVAAVKSVIEERYSGPMAYIHMAHNGSLGATLKISAKVRLEGMDPDSLYFYLYNERTDTLTEIEDPKAYVDNSDFLHFYTKTGGDIVIADTPLD